MPQMGPIMWLLFPFVVVVLNMMLMIVNSSDKVEVGLDNLFDGIGIVIKW